MNKLTTALKISTMSVALLSATAVATVLVTPDVAYAGKGNDNGGGNGGGNGKSGGAGGKADKSDSKGKSASAKGQSGKSGKTKTLRASDFSLKSIFGQDKQKRTVAKKSVTKKTVAKSHAPKVAKAPAPKPAKPKLADVLGVHPSELGALNAAHASPQALANASPNSRVGKIALYMNEVAASRELEADLAAAQAELALLDVPTRSAEEIGLAIDTAMMERSDLETQLDDLNTALGEAGGADETIEADIATVTEALGAKDAEIAALEQEQADGEAYAEALNTVETIEGELETQSATQREALEAAANKEVTDEVEAAVQRLLGIYVEPEVVEDPEMVEDEIVEGDVVEDVATLE